MHTCVCFLKKNTESRFILKAHGYKGLASRTPSRIGWFYSATLFTQNTTEECYNVATPKISLIFTS